MKVVFLLVTAIFPMLDAIFHNIDVISEGIYGSERLPFSGN